MTGEITTIGELEACVGVAGLPVKMKIIDHLDAQARGWIAASRLAFVGLGGQSGPRATLAGGADGFATTPDARTVRIPRDALEDAGPLAVGDGAGLLFLVGGLGETLRANGQVAAVSDTAVDVRVEECFLHCAKALIRSDFWGAAPQDAPDAAEAFLAQTRYLALATMDAEGRIDVSPKGDPAGGLIRSLGDRAVLAERPGNRLAFGYRNMLEQPRVAALGIAPGADKVLRLTGRATLTADEALRETFVVDGKTPILATQIAIETATVSASLALKRAAPWPAADAPPAIDPSAVLVAHVKLNKAKGASAVLLRLAVNRGLVAKGLEANYRTELY